MRTPLSSPPLPLLPRADWYGMGGVQVTLHPAIIILQRDIQHPRLLLRGAPVRAGSRQLDDARPPPLKTAVDRGRSAAAAYSARGEAVEADDWEEGRYGRCVYAFFFLLRLRALGLMCSLLPSLHHSLPVSFRGLAAYVYRMCLEYARLWADDRASMSYK